jgi:hypothetical protein
MLARAAFLLIAAFWLTMNVLLWRMEYGARGPMSGDVPWERVWGKMLTAPDSSPLRILHRGRNVGFCHWVTSVSESASPADATLPEGMVRRASGYRAQLEGTVLLEDGARARFDAAMTLAANHDWQELHARLNLRPTVWRLHASAAARHVTLRVEEDGGVFERQFAFDELKRPDALLREFADPLTYALLNASGLSTRALSASGLTAGLTWSVRQDWLRLGRSRVRVYRVEARWMERIQAAATVSFVGELLRLELPDGWVLENDRLAGF